MNLEIKEAEENDIPLILSFIKKLAEYEKLCGSVFADENKLKESLFGSGKAARVLLVFHQKKAVAFAVYFFNFSTFLGRKGLYLEDVFVLPEERGKGIGERVLKRLAQIAVENNCGRFEWAVLDWNKPAMKFYEKLGAAQMEDWRIYRLDEAGIKNLAEK